MSAETMAINMWLDSVLSIDENLIELLGEPFNNATVIKRLTNYKAGNFLYVPFTGTGKVYKAIADGRTSVTEPTFPTDDMETVVDGTVTWQVSGDVGVRPRIFQGISPANAKTPFIVYNLQTPETTKRVGKGSSDIFGTYTYLIKATDEGEDLTNASKIADIVDDLLNLGENVFGPVITFNNKNYQIYGSFRDMPVEYPEIDDNKRFNHIGGMYQIVIAVKDGD